MNKNVLVCGGAGYIGSTTCKVLKSFGYNPVTLDNLSTGYKQLVKFGPFEEADIRDTNAVKTILQRYKPIAVISFAAFSLVGESVVEPWKYFDNNFVATNNFLKTMIDNNINNFILSSTAAIFGDAKVDIIHEDTITLPINAYGKSKLMIEMALDDYDRAYGLKYTSLRYFNVSGSEPEFEVGELHSPETHLIPVMLDKAAKGLEFSIFGNDYNTKDGTCIRDYIHVYDLAIAHVKAMEKLINTKQSIKINLGNGSGFSVLEMVNAAKKVLGIDFKIKFADRRKGDPSTLVTDNSLAKNYLNWTPIYTNVEDHIKHAWEWYKKTNNLKI